MLEGWEEPAIERLPDTSTVAGRDVEDLDGFDDADPDIEGETKKLVSRGGREVCIRIRAWSRPSSRCCPSSRIKQRFSGLRAVQGHVDSWGPVP